MPKGMRISLKAARANANMTQEEAANELSKYFGMKVSRQRVMNYEAHPEVIQTCCKEIIKQEAGDDRTKEKSHLEGR